MAASASEKNNPAFPQVEPSVGSDTKSAAEKYGWPRQNSRGYKIHEEPFGTSRPMKVIHIGAGASGLCFAKFAHDRLKNVEVVLYEKNNDVGGTWLENRYPGCACDIPSVNYQYTWARNANWSHYYSGAVEIWEYFKNVAVEHDLLKYVKLRHEIIHASWNDENGLWHVKVRSIETGEEFEDVAEVLINGGGILNNWKWPDVKGLHTFKGKLMHSAAYEERYPLNGKHVAVVGAGSSGIQIVATIANSVKKLYSWVRSPTWVTAGFAQRFAGPDGQNFAYTEAQKAEFARDPKKLMTYSKLVENELNQRFKFILKHTPEAEDAKAFSALEMSRELGGDKRLIEAIVPKEYGVGCRRPTPGNGFLKALTRDNVTVFTESLQCVTEKGFIDHTGVEHEVDVIICATGFDTTWVPRFPIIANENSIQDTWSEELSSYLSIGVPHMPNYWMTIGPYGPFGHGSLIPFLETLVSNFIQCISKMQKERIKSMTPKQSIVEAFKEHSDLFLQRTTWSEGCTSWFKQGRVDGPLTMWPGSRIMYIEMMENARFEDYEIQYINPLNPLEFLGNGFSARETDGRDLSFYLGLIDGIDKQLDLEAELQFKM